MSTTAPHPAPVPPATPRKKRRWPWIVGSLVVLTVIIAATANHGGTTANTTTANNTTANKVAAASTAHVPAQSAHAAAPTSAAATPVVLYSKTGTGTGSTPDFTTGAEWQVAYTYDCSAFGSPGNFAVTSEDFQLAIDQLGMKGADTEYVHGDPGTHSLSIDSECAWTIKVLG